MEFEWDPEKALRNLCNHGVSFESAIAVFRDPRAIEWIDDREDYGEERMVRIAHAHGALLTVVYTEQGQTNRIISARKASKNEQDEYYRENAL